jgi:hypothetical protein
MVLSNGRLDVGKQGRQQEDDMLENLITRAAKITGTDKLRRSVENLITRAWDGGQRDRTRDIMITLTDNGYGEAADFIKANYTR